MDYVTGIRNIVRRIVYAWNDYYKSYASVASKNKLFKDIFDFNGHTPRVHESNMINVLNSSTHSQLYEFLYVLLPISYIYTLSGGVIYSLINKLKTENLDDVDYDTTRKIVLFGIILYIKNRYYNTSIQLFDDDALKSDIFTSFFSVTDRVTFITEIEHIFDKLQSFNPEQLHKFLVNIRQITYDRWFTHLVDMAKELFELQINKINYSKKENELLQ